MIYRHMRSFYRPTRLWFLFVLIASGCHSMQHRPTSQISPASQLTADESPRELYKSFLPPYVIEPPDLLVIEAVSLTPKMPYNLRTGDVLSIQVLGAFTDAPIDGMFPIQPGGSLDLGMPYGTVNVGGMTLEKAREEVTNHLKTQLKEPQVVLNIGQIAAMQQVQGEHLVKMDGTVRLGTYGSILVVGMTLDEAEQTVERHLANYLDNPDVSIDVFAYNSKSYYVILQGAGMGDQLTKFPITGNETVLDAITQVGGLTAAQSKRMWIARPGPNYEGGYKILPVDYNSIVRLADVTTNYQLLPGDRLFVAQDRLVTMDNNMGKIIAPVERVSGFILLGISTMSRLTGQVLSQSSGNSGIFIP